MPTRYRENNRTRWLGVRPAHDGEQIVASGSKANGISILYTVPADKTLLIFQSWASWYSVAISAGSLAIQDDSNVLWYTMLLTPSLNPSCGAVAVPYPVPLEVPAGYDIYIESLVAGHVQRGGFTGILISS